jgi:hypothetical protein
MSPVLSRAALPLRARQLLGRTQFSLAAALRLTGWLAVTVLAALGLLAFIFLALGNFSVPGTMHQLDNLASRYVAADAARQAQFNGLLAAALGALAAATAFFRRASVLRILTGRETTHG